MAVPGGIPRFDPEGPSSARLVNYLLEGRNYGQADEAAARELLGICPQVRRVAKVGRLFAVRAAGWAASIGVTQIIDLGSGLPPGPGEALHQVVSRSVRPGVRAAYVDLDEMALGEVDAGLGECDGDAALVCQDLRDPAAVLSDPGLTKVIDAGRPVLVLAGLVLHFQPARAARQVVAGYAGRVAAGSLVAVSVPRFADRAMLAALNRAYAPSTLHDFTDDEVRCLFRPGDDPAGWLGLVPPGIAPAAGLRPGWADAAQSPPAGAYVVAGIGRKR